MNFADSLHEVFERFGPVTVRRMFGGHGVYREDVMFALVAGGALYLKADGENAAEFAQRGLAPFEFTKRGKLTQMSYYLAPAEVMEDRDEAANWARRSYEAALRARKPK